MNCYSTPGWSRACIQYRSKKQSHRTIHQRLLQQSLPRKAKDHPVDHLRKNDVPNPIRCVETPESREGQTQPCFAAPTMIVPATSDAAIIHRWIRLECPSLGTLPSPALGASGVMCPTSSAVTQRQLCSTDSGCGAPPHPSPLRKPQDSFVPTRTLLQLQQKRLLAGREVLQALLEVRAYVGG